jgi:type I restriction enzyme S subunit
MRNKMKATAEEVQSRPALVPKLRFPEFREAAGWKGVPLSELVGALDAGVSVNSGDRPATGNEIGILKTSAVTNGIFEPEANKVVVDEAKRGRVKEPVQGGTIIISRMNTPALVEANAYIETDFKNLYLPDRLWAAKARPDTSMRFVASILGSDKSRAALSKLAKGSSGSMKNITKPDVLAFLVVVPSPAEQHIATSLSSLDTLITTETQKLEALKTHKKGLMQQLFLSPEETLP